MLPDLVSAMVLGQLGKKLAWALLRQRRVGIDDVGNIYYIKQEKNLKGELVEKRLVKYVGEYDPQQLPPAWAQWLTRSRDAPPTQAEIDESNINIERKIKAGNKADEEAEIGAVVHKRQNSSGYRTPKIQISDPPP